MKIGRALYTGRVTGNFRARMMSTKAAGNRTLKTAMVLPSLHQEVDIKDSGRRAWKKETGSACIPTGASISMCE